jgi:hypothetical protein
MSSTRDQTSPNHGSAANSSARHVSCFASLPQEPRRAPLSLTLDAFGDCATMNLFERFFHNETPLERLKRLAESYDPRGGDADTLQGALADAVLCLHDEGCRNGWLNGGEFHAECIDLIKKYLCDQPVGIPSPDQEQIATNLETIRDAALGGAFKGRFAYEQLDQLQIDVAQWCRANPKPIHREYEQDTW